MAVEEKNVNTNIDNEGNVCISNDVVATIASITAKSVEGVAGMFSSLTGGFAELLGRKNPSKGVKVTITDKEVTIDMFVVVEYGVKIPEVAWEIQEKTKNEVEAMTGLAVVAVNVNIEGVNTSKKDDEIAADEEIVAAEPDTEE
jgi:uncharacterized alkaline shock family protein YloU